jgi:hypothetical protein
VTVPSKPADAPTAPSRPKRVPGDAQAAAEAKSPEL